MSENTATLNELLNNYELELPLLPEVAGKVMAMTSDDNANSSSLAALIQQDQALAGNVLKITNSAA